MKLKLIKPTTVDVNLLKVFCGGRLEDKSFDLGDEHYECLEDLLNAYPMLRGEPDHCNELMLIIEVDTGRVRNWPINKPSQFFDVKVVDEGTYILYDTYGKEIAKYEGYVPECLGPDGYGDYFEFEISSNGYINDWYFCQSNFNELLKID